MPFQCFTCCITASGTQCICTVIPKGGHVGQTHKHFEHDFYSNTCFISKTIIINQKSEWNWFNHQQLSIQSVSPDSFQLCFSCALLIFSKLVFWTGQQPQLFPDAYVMPFVPLCNPPCGKRSGPLLDHEIGYKSRVCSSGQLALRSHSSEIISQKI